MNNATAKAFRTVGTALVVTGIMTACTVFPTPEAPRVMDFPAPQNVEKSVTINPQSLRVDTPLATEPGDGAAAQGEAARLRAAGACLVCRSGLQADSVCVSPGAL